MLFDSCHALAGRHGNRLAVGNLLNHPAADQMHLGEIQQKRNSHCMGLSGMSMNGEVQKYQSFFNEVNKSFRLENDISESSRATVL